MRRWQYTKLANGFFILKIFICSKLRLKRLAITAGTACLVRAHVTASLFSSVAGRKQIILVGRHVHSCASETIRPIAVIVLH